MKKQCTNCLKQYKQNEECTQCGKMLGIEFVCVKVQSNSAHFCSKKCADKIAVAAHYKTSVPKAESLPQGYECKKCGYRWAPTESEISPKLCPDCASPNLIEWKNDVARGKS